MHKLATIFFSVLLTLFLSGSVFASPKKSPATTKIDTSKIQVKSFDGKRIADFKKDKDFNYNGPNESDGQPSLWTRFWNWLWNALFGWIGKVPYSGVVIKYLLLGLAIALLIYIVFKSLDIDPIKLLRGEVAKTNLPYQESQENIHEINFDDEIEKAVSQHNFRLAVRLLYLKCLKQLSDDRLIQWQIDKTNQTYFYELTDPVQKENFGLLTRQFEYVWYGDFAIDQQAFGYINQLFKNFKKQRS